MTYRELLEICKKNAGCLASKEQKELEAKRKYQLMVMRSYQNDQKKDK